MSELPIRSSPSSAGAAAHPLWHWWLGELRAVLPATASRWLDGGAMAADISVDEKSVLIIATGDGATRPVPHRVPMEGLPSDPVLRNLIAAGRDRVRLVLTPDQVMVKTISLPSATEENLREVIGFELDRHTPFTLDQAYYDVQMVRRDPQHEKITISLAVASKAEIATLVATLRNAGLTCTAIGVDSSVVANARSFDLQPAFEKPARRLSRMHRINLGLLGVAALMAFAAIILPIWQKREAVKVLIPQAEKAGTEFQISERVYTEYTKLAAEYNFLAAKKHAVYPVLSVLEELARTFPDTTWVQRLDIKQNGKVREVTLLGEAQSTSRVIENLEQSPMALFQNSKQLTQTLRLQPNTERFHVSAEIKPRPVPAAESIDDVIAPAASLPHPAPNPLPSPAAAGAPAAGGAGLPSAANSSSPPMMTTVPAVSPATANLPLSTFNGPPAALPGGSPLPAKAPATAPAPEKRSGS